MDCFSAGAERSGYKVNKVELRERQREVKHVKDAYIEYGKERIVEERYLNLTENETPQQNVKNVKEVFDGEKGCRIVER